jgi:hypothetical protein
MKGYAVYENYPNNKAVGHSTACPFFKLHGGMLQKQEIGLCMRLNNKQ